MKLSSTRIRSLCSVNRLFNRRTPQTTTIIHATAPSSDMSFISSFVQVPSVSWRFAVARNNHWHCLSTKTSPATSTSDETETTSTTPSIQILSKHDEKKKDDVDEELLLGKSKKEETNVSSSTTALPLIYDSPLGNVISKLRAVSLSTAIIGMTGVPCMIAIKGGTIPEAGILAAALLFVSGSIGSTAAIHFVFSPYVYKIEQIPIRVCSTTTDNTSTNALIDNDKVQNSSTSIDNAAQSEVDRNINDLDRTLSPKNRDTLLKAWVRTLFLRHDTIIFDPTIDVQPYKGYRPLCNFVAKGRPLYVHTEYVYDTKLRAAMNIHTQKTLPITKENPDDDFL